MRFSRNARGQAILELAAAAPLLLLLMLGIIEVSRFTYFAIQVNNAARAAAQYGTQNRVTILDTNGIKQAAINDTSNLPTTLTIASSHSCTCSDGSTSTCQPTDCSASHQVVYLQVNTSGAFRSLFSYPGLPSSLTLHGAAIMRMTQ